MHPNKKQGLNPKYLMWWKWFFGIWRLSQLNSQTLKKCIQYSMFYALAKQEHKHAQTNMKNPHGARSRSDNVCDTQPTCLLIAFKYSLKNLLQPRMWPVHGGSEIWRRSSIFCHMYNFNKGWIFNPNNDVKHKKSPAPSGNVGSCSILVHIVFYIAKQWSVCKISCSVATRS